MRGKPLRQRGEVRGDPFHHPRSLFALRMNERLSLIDKRAEPTGDVAKCLSACSLPLGDFFEEALAIASKVRRDAFGERDERLSIARGPLLLSRDHRFEALSKRLLQRTLAMGLRFEECFMAGGILLRPRGALFMNRREELAGMHSKAVELGLGARFHCLNHRIET